VIHARAELLYYDPKLAYDLGTRITKLQPSANEYLLSLTDWLSGEVRFTTESGHRVPHDPLTGLDRSIELLDRVIDSAMPYSNEEALGFYQDEQDAVKRGSIVKQLSTFSVHSGVRQPCPLQPKLCGKWARACTGTGSTPRLRVLSIDPSRPSTISLIGGCCECRWNNRRKMSSCRAAWTSQLANLRSILRIRRFSLLRT
jgi:hypothetical protein